MIDPKKVRLMTKLAVYEEGPGKKDLRINGYSNRTYVNIKQLESVIAIPAAYILGKGSFLLGVVLTFVVSFISIFIANRIWLIGIKRYESSGS